MSFHFLNAQNGYVITKDDSVFTGFLHYQLVFGTTNEFEIELQKFKKDKKPRRFHLESLKEFAYKKDTFAVLTNFYPFLDRNLFIELIKIKLVERGHITLYWSNEIEESTYSYNMSSQGFLMPTSSSSMTYLIGDNKGYIVAIDPLNFDQEIRQYLDLVEGIKQLGIRKVKYDHIPELIKYHNRTY